MHVSAKAIRAFDLNPTQKKISLEKVFNHLVREVSLARFFEDELLLTEPIVTYKNKILDGHHRYAEAFIIYPKCKISCLEFTNKNEEFEEFLNRFKSAEKSKEKLTKNLFTLSRDSIKIYCR